MNIYTVRDNLKNTIAGKEAYLEEVRKARLDIDLPATADTAYFATAEFLELNLRELRGILRDVEQCIEKDVYNSWKENPDRMGGQFTDEEINRVGEWR